MRSVEVGQIQVRAAESVRNVRDVVSQADSYRRIESCAARIELERLAQEGAVVGHYRVVVKHFDLNGAQGFVVLVQRNRVAGDEQTERSARIAELHLLLHDAAFVNHRDQVDNGDHTAIGPRVRVGGGV